MPVPNNLRIRKKRKKVNATFITNMRKRGERMKVKTIPAGYPMLKTKIRYSRKVSESTYARKPIPLYSARSLAAKDYECLVKEYLVAAGVMMDKWTEGRKA